jgi:hypothetical protein
MRQLFNFFMDDIVKLFSQYLQENVLIVWRHVY